MENYTASILESSKELTARERIAAKDTTNANKIDTAIDDAEFGKLVITPVAYVILSIHNEKSKDRKDYENYLIFDESGAKYITGSPSFWNSFKAIWDEMAEANEEGYSIECYKVPSKNYSGKEFLTCSII